MMETEIQVQQRRVSDLRWEYEKADQEAARMQSEADLQRRKAGELCLKLEAAEDELARLKQLEADNA